MAYSGKYYPRNPTKYRGLVRQIVWRSTWERKFMKFCDLNKTVLAWSSEEKNCIVPYKSPIDGRYHRYFVDFWMRVKNKKGETKEYLVEIKPEHQEHAPPKRKKASKKYEQELATYLVNQAKWEAAKSYATKRNMEFLVLNENHLGV